MVGHQWLFLCLNNSASCHEGVWGSKGIAPPCLTSAVDGGEWSAWRLGHFTPTERVHDTHWRGFLMGSKASLDAVEKRKVCCPFQKLNVGHPAHSLLLYGLRFPSSNPLTFNYSNSWFIFNGIIVQVQIWRECKTVVSIVATRLGIEKVKYNKMWKRIESCRI